MVNKIVIDARPIATSTGRYLFNLVRELAEIDKQNDYIVLVWSNFNRGELPLPDNFKYETADYPISGSLSEQLGFKKQLDGLRADLVHFGMTQQPVRYSGKKVTTIHDLTTLRFVNSDKNAAVFKAKQQAYRWLTKKVAKQSAAIITPSHFVKDDLVNLTGISPNKIEVVYEAAEPIKHKAEPLPELEGKKFIMYVGRSTPHKNLERLIQAFQQLDLPDLYLVLAGKKDGNYQRIEAQNISNIIFTDFIADSQLRWLYEQCQAYVFPSLSEGFGLPGLEAMAHGAPVVSSNATCLPEVYGDAARYFDPQNVDAMAQAINDVLTDEKLRENLVKTGHQQVKKYSWKRTAEQTLAVYKRVLGE